jgi:Domain of unknown function (DUF4279)
LKASRRERLVPVTRVFGRLEVVVSRLPPSGPPGTVWFGGHPDEARLRLWVQGDALDPDAVSQALGSGPTQSKRKGDAILTPAGAVRRIARTGSWLLSSQVAADATLTEAVGALFDGLTPDPTVWASLASRFRVELVCEVTLKCFNRGWEIPPELLKRLADRHVTLSFDVFYMGDLHERDAVLERVEAAEPSRAPDGGGT